jgi:GTP pyrophosphokinase
MGFKKGEDFYIALGQAKISAKTVTSKLMGRLKEGESALEPPSVAAELMERKETPKRTAASSTYGIKVDGVDDVMLRLAKCCRPVPGDPIVGYISLGRGITVHREDCPNVRSLLRNPERFTPVEWEGGASAGFLVQISVDAWDRARLLEDVARTFAEHGANIVSYGGVVEDGMARNWYTAEVGDVKELRSLLTALRNLDAVFDAYRVTPS